ncbi:hypothetical protein CN376_22930 [Bacillus cereus]|uniref:hypothetical protein n=1 Tax=Bacillus cereus TaxID=1396 RepID=UPI000BFA46E7|nr:hypothetical protein [Bacillus cereus]PEZ87938.1 hypothetical protein CN376_22930 [Bacillus cereus]PFR12590.1 hypothetical protein COK30_13655 [Bacillus cereus]
MSKQMVCKKNYKMDEGKVAFKKGKVYEFTRCFEGEEYKAISEISNDHYIGHEIPKKYFIEFKGFKEDN